MTRTLVAWLLAAGAAVGARAALAQESWALLALGVLVGSAAVFAGTRRVRRPVALVGVLVGAAAAALLTKGMGDRLRGERPDVGPDPLVARQDPRASGTHEVWLLHAGAHELRYRALGPEPAVHAAPGAADVRLTVENRPARPPAPAGPIRVAVWGDCRGGVTVLGRLTDAIRRQQPDFAVGLGDFVGMARRYQFALLARRFERIGIPLYAVPGNHDLDPQGTLRPYARIFGPPNWSFTFRGTLFVGLDTARGVLDPADVDRVARVVAARGQDVQHVLLFCHHPLFAPAGHPEKPLPEDTATKRLRALVLREGIQVFASHYHGFDRQTHGTATQICTGGAGARPESDEPYHYVQVEIDEKGVRTKEVVLAQQAEIHPVLDRLLTFRDEAAWGAGTWPWAAAAALLGLLLLLGSAARLLRGASARAAGAPPQSAGDRRG